MARVVRVEGEEGWSDGRVCTAGRGEGGSHGRPVPAGRAGVRRGSGRAARAMIGGGTGSRVSAQVATAAVSSCFRCVIVFGCEVRYQGRGWAEGMVSSVTANQV